MNNIKEFINYIINYNNIDEILDNYKSQTEKGFIFERLFDIIIKFGFCDLFPNSIYNHLIGNVNNAKLKILDRFNNYLNEKVISGNSSGCSDITLYNKNDNMYIFISCKYPKDSNDKSIQFYDIQNIIAMIDSNKEIYKKYDIYLLVDDKKKVLNKVVTFDVFQLFKGWLNFAACANVDDNEVTLEMSHELSD